MMLRLALVGMVAALGVSIPSQPGSGSWFVSAEAWATSLLAEWDTWEPSNGDESGVAHGHIGCEECRLARLRILANASGATSPVARSASNAGSAPTPSNSSPSITAAKEVPSPSKAADAIAFDPIHLEENSEAGVAFELNRMSEGLVTTPVACPSTVAASKNSETILPEDVAELGIWGELYRIALEPPVAAKPVGATAESQSDPDPADASFICGFGSADAAEPASVPVAAELSKLGRTLPAKSGSVMPSVESAGSCLADEWAWNELPDETLVAPPTVPTLADLPRDVFTPEPVTAQKADVRSASVLVDLPRDVFTPDPAEIGRKPLVSNEMRTVVINTIVKTAAPPADLRVATVESTGRSSPPPSASSTTTISCAPESQQTAGDRSAESAQPSTSSVSQPPRLGDAVELTRKAVYAWVSVLIGPDAAEHSHR
jgi:hypothetical protein